MTHTHESQEIQSPIDHATYIAELLHTLRHYSPIRLITEVPDIDGAVYEKPSRHRGDTERARFARLGGSILEIVGDGDDIHVMAQVTPKSQPTLLQPKDIRSVQADHPLGRHMPLNGRREPSAWPVAPHYPGTPTFAWAPRFIEYDYYDYIVTGKHPEYPGISTVRAYDAQSRKWRDATNHNKDIPTLEEAIEATKGGPITLYMSKIAISNSWVSLPDREQPNYVVTSNSGFDIKEGRGVRVLRPQYPENDKPAPLKIDMYDMPKGTTDEELLKTHIKRWYGMTVERRHHYPDIPMTDFEADSVYLYMSAD